MHLEGYTDLEDILTGSVRLATSQDLTVKRIGNQDDLRLPVYTWTLYLGKNSAGHPALVAEMACESNNDRTVTPVPPPEKMPAVRVDGKYCTWRVGRLIPLQAGKAAMLQASLDKAQAIRNRDLMQGPVPAIITKPEPILEPTVPPPTLQEQSITLFGNVSALKSRLTLAIIKGDLAEQATIEKDLEAAKAKLDAILADIHKTKNIPTPTEDEDDDE